MTKLQTSLYDPSKSYRYNLKHGPFGDFARENTYQNLGDPKYDFFGSKVYSPFGIAAGPLPGAHFVEAAFNKGFDIVTFKSVRTGDYPCHPAPNIMPVELDSLNPVKTDNPITIKTSYDAPLSIANSLGIPSFEPKVWQPEITKSFGTAGKGQAMLVAFQGTDRGDGHEAFIQDHVKGARLLKNSGARVIEVNLSCPNEGSSELLCFDIPTTEKIITRIRDAVDDLQLIVKITYFCENEHLGDFVRRIGPLVDGITAINTVAARVVGMDGKQAFPGSMVRAKPGLSGEAIKHLGLDMVSRLDRYRRELGLAYKIIGVGGVGSPRDFHDYRANGADVVMSVTGAMWNPQLAAEIKATLGQNPAAAGRG